MGALIIMIGGVVGLIVAAASYLYGASMLWSLVIYAAVGNSIAAWLLMRYHRDSESDQAYMRREIETELEALGEMRMSGVMDPALAERSPVLFRTLRLQARMNQRYGSRGA